MVEPGDLIIKLHQAMMKKNEKPSRKQRPGDIQVVVIDIFLSQDLTIRFKVYPFPILHNFYRIIDSTITMKDIDRFNDPDDVLEFAFSKVKYKVKDFKCAPNRVDVISKLLEKKNTCVYLNNEKESWWWKMFRSLISKI